MKVFQTTDLFFGEMWLFFETIHAKYFRFDLTLKKDSWYRKLLKTVDKFFNFTLNPSRIQN